MAEEEDTEGSLELMLARAERGNEGARGAFSALVRPLPVPAFPKPPMFAVSPERSTLLQASSGSGGMGSAGRERQAGDRGKGAKDSKGKEKEGEDVRDMIDQVQRYLDQLQYNHTGTKFFHVHKEKPLNRLLETAKHIVREALPIKCLEAAIVAIHLTMPLTKVDRFCISFKTAFGSKQYRHIVLGIHFNGMFGALGLSRRSTLMYKPLVYTSLADLIKDFEKSYNDVYHRLLRVRLSTPISHDPYCVDVIEWRYFVILLHTLPWEECEKALADFSRGLRKKVIKNEVKVVRQSSAGSATGARSKDLSRRSSPALSRVASLGGMGEKDRVGEAIEQQGKAAAFIVKV